MTRVAAAQMKVSKSDIEKNTKAILEFIDRAAKKNVDIVCFPETCINPDEEAVVDVSGPLERIKKRCAKRRIHAIVGSYLPYQDKARNATILIGRDGKVKRTYYKRHLWNTEVGKVIPGKKNHAVKTDVGTIGLINCWDFAFPEDLRRLTKKCLVVFCPSYLVSFREDGDALKYIPLVRAFENLVYYVSVDAFTKETFSQSAICHPQRELKRIKHRQGLIVADIDPEEIERLRRFYNHV